MAWVEHERDGVAYRQHELTGEVQAWVTAKDGRQAWVTVMQPQSTGLARRERAEPEVIQLPAPASPVQHVVSVKSSRTDQAIGFSIKTWQLAVVAGVGIAAIRYGLAGSPWSFAGATVTVLVGFFVVWLLAFFIDAVLSPDGIALFHTWRMWRYYDADQRHRHRRDR